MENVAHPLLQKRRQESSHHHHQQQPQPQPQHHYHHQQLHQSQLPQQPQHNQPQYHQQQYQQQFHQPSPPQHQPYPQQPQTLSQPQPQPPPPQPSPQSQQQQPFQLSPFPHNVPHLQEQHQQYMQAFTSAIQSYNPAQTQYPSPSQYSQPPPVPASNSSSTSPQIQQALTRRSSNAVTSTPASRSVTKKSASGSFYTLACLNCRSKKIKCMLEEGGCKKCKKLGIPCPGPEVDERKRPSSKRHIRELYNRIAELEQALKQSETLRRAQSQNFYTLQGMNQFSPTESPENLLRRKVPNNIIARLCDGRYQLNYDAEGRLRYFGPTSSLHLTETVTSTIVGAWGEQITDSKVDVFEIDRETQDYLLNLYWKYQHTELQVFHREAFLRDMESGQTKFYSKALLYCIMACAARISHRPEIRSLVLSPDLATMEERPPLFAAASRLTDEELKRPQVTTVPALLLLSVIYCASSQDTKGWVLTGTACRLALDLGLHRDCSTLSADGLSPLDIEARKVSFWGCVVFDRLWSLYLGRQFCLKLDEDVTISRPGGGDPNAAFELKLADAWTRLLEIIGLICESLNQNKCTMMRVNELGDRLRGWYEKLDPSLYYQSEGSPSVAVMHMQYCSAVIILYRPLADFGIDTADKTQNSAQFRLACVSHAKDVGRYLDDYRKKHSNATTLSGIALHIISTAATTLVADIAERRNCDVTDEFNCLISCVRTLLELEQTYLVASQVRKILKLVIRLCNIETPQIRSASTLPENFAIGASVEASPSSSSSHPSSSPGDNKGNIQSGEDSADEEVERDPNSELLMQRFNSLPPDGPVEVEPLQMPPSCYPGMTYNSFPFIDEMMNPAEHHPNNPY